MPIILVLKKLVEDVPGMGWSVVPTQLVNLGSVRKILISNTKRNRDTLYRS